MTIQPRGTKQTGEQLKMFMTPREIHAQYQPLDADRLESESGSGYPSSGTPRSVAQNTGGNNVRHGQARWGTDTGGSYQASTYGTKWRSSDRSESDEELWGRKLEESEYEHTVPAKPTQWEMGSAHYHAGGTATADLSTRQRAERSFARENYGTSSYMTEDEPRVKREGTPERSLYESIAEEGVKSPIRLGRQVGSMGKPQIVGGHHRLASQTALNEDQFVPVLHHEDIWEARSPSTTKAWKYT